MKLISRTTYFTAEINKRTPITNLIGVKHSWVSRLYISLIPMELVGTSY